MPATLAGVEAYFRLLRRQSDVTDNIDSMATMQALLQGNAAVVLTDTRAILRFLQEDTPETRKIGAASVMSIPYTGGNNLVIWRHTYGYPERLAATFKLVEFMTCKNTLLKQGRQVQTLPVRIDALDELIPAEHPMRPVIVQLVSSGRTYPSIRLWRRIESQLGQELSLIAKTVLTDRNADPDTIVTDSMKALTRRLNLTLE
jgi:hypothetical protein